MEDAVTSQMKLKSFLRRPAVMVAIGMCAVASTFVFLTVAQSGPRVSNSTIPIPFIPGENHGAAAAGSNLAGSVTYIRTLANGVEFYEMDFVGDTSQTAAADKVFLVRVPTGVTSIPFERVIVDSNGATRPYYGYIYTSSTAATEIANQSASGFAVRFPGLFFASAAIKAAHGADLSAFETINGIVFKTSTEYDTASGARLKGPQLIALVPTDQNMLIDIAPVCGNGWKANTEDCDDGDLTAGDGCSATCTIESGFTCDATSEQSVCTPDAACGDGLVTNGETCDDGNTTAGDGCNATCAVESGFTCDTGEPSVCTQTCGNGVRGQGETCDDGNATAGDGCSATCAVENGYTCNTATPNVCDPDTVAPVCGNSEREGDACGNAFVDNNEECDWAIECEFTVDGDDCTCHDDCTACDGNEDCAFTAPTYVGETCDDGNTTDADGCNATCDVEGGFTCDTASPNVCSPIVAVCGNGIRQNGEACDDGDTTSGDGCSATCTIENGYSCTTATPNVCDQCGNGTLASTEQCDDANTTAGDGCSATCTIESGFTCADCAAGPTITEFTGTGGIFAVTAGPDGNIWYTESTGLNIVKITSTGATTKYAITNGAPDGGITLGPDGNVWFTKGIANKISRITSTGAVTDFAVLTANSKPIGIIAGPDGNLWFTESDANKIGRITPSGIVTEFTIPTANSEPLFLAAGPDGNVWFTQTQANKIGRITSTGAITEFAIPTANSQPYTIAAGPDGNLWFTEFQANKIAKITPTGTITEFDLAANTHPYGIALGPDGNLWFTEFDGNKIGRITPGGTIAEFDIPTSNAEPTIITLGPDGNLWFAEYSVTQDKIGKLANAICPDNNNGSICSADPACGDSTRNSGESCDDGDTTAGDGCNATCAIESGFACTTASPNVCASNSDCGNSLREAGETCDDGNTTDGDGCDAVCAVESGYSCDTASPNVCTPDVVCGDGTREGGETCDDGNTTAGDGCDAVCAVESGYSCTTATPNVCDLCGNGTRGGTEACDDGDTTAGDGCNATCGVESGYSCDTGSPNICDQCGNGTIAGGETCDDTNTTAGDGCSAACLVENGFSCSGEPSTCIPIVCGNGVRQLGEGCDDGNTTSGDGCTDVCQIEVGWGCNMAQPNVCALDCEDIDSVNIVVASHVVTFGSSQVQDRCDANPLADELIYEQTCNNTTHLREEVLHFCPVGTKCNVAVSGAASCTAAGAPPPSGGELDCSDTDGGFDISVAGTATNLSGSDSDICVNGNTGVQETYCARSDGTVRHISLSCANGCTSGACNP